MARRKRMREEEKRRERRKEEQLEERITRVSVELRSIRDYVQHQPNLRRGTAR